MRLFVGIPLAPEAAVALAGVQALLSPASRDLRWSTPESWHVTLQFLGRTTSEQAACVNASLPAVRSVPVPIQIAGLDFFERAGVFHAGVKITSELLTLQQKVTEALRPCGFVPEARAYHPHVTLARSKNRSAGSAFMRLKEALARSRIDLAAEFVAEEFLLYESIPTPSGSRYKVRARFPLIPVSRSQLTPVQG
jgi:2'-5' RNA ligase